ncbi:type III pantothenate kinase [Harryflintia acetispora]|uniref:Type III pantothenate kinase n=1 Tax=Harryflintia acetispora TaxID=1849041 RepID=A0A9X8UKJ6_9FIRM|nr:type III pantothenate kinase [Harryflintia acetispora]TCL44492.1 type III pantothenate kinase [Harryflintia acetispora]
MILTVDIGNAQIKAGGFIGERLSFVLRLDTDERRTAGLYAAQLRELLSLYGFGGVSFEGAIVSSVVPLLLPVLEEALHLIGAPRVLTVGPGIKTGLNLKIDNPVGTGPDLVCGAVGALQLCNPPCVIFDFGTATTVAALDGSGALVGKAIMAGVQISLDALAERTACLPRLGVAPPGALLGKNTQEAMLGGAVYGAAAMTDGLISRYRAIYGESLTCILTGGLSGQIVPCCESEVTHEPNLNLLGLRAIYLRNS